MLKARLNFQNQKYSTQFMWHLNIVSYTVTFTIQLGHFEENVK